MSRKPIAHWTVEELKKIVTRKFEAAAKQKPGPKRQKFLREAKRYESSLDTKIGLARELNPPANEAHPESTTPLKRNMIAQRRW
jgi:hypothetical protein